MNSSVPMHRKSSENACFWGRPPQPNLSLALAQYQLEGWLCQRDFTETEVIPLTFTTLGVLS